MSKWGPCAEPRCPVLVDTTYCPDHRPAAWSGSTRHERLPSDWQAVRRAVLERDDYTCQYCGIYGDRVDHVVRGDNHHPDNLATICLDCDMRKSGHEGGSSQGRSRHE